MDGVVRKGQPGPLVPHPTPTPSSACVTSASLGRLWEQGMFGEKLRFTLSGIWANHRSRGGGRGVGDASGRRRVPKDPKLTGRGQGRPGLSLLSPDTNLEALSQVCYPGSSPHQLASPKMATASAAWKELHVWRHQPGG